MLWILISKLLGLQEPEEHKEAQTTSLLKILQRIVDLINALKRFKAYVKLSLPWTAITHSLLSPTFTIWLMISIQMSRFQKTRGSWSLKESTLKKQEKNLTYLRESSKRHRWRLSCTNLSKDRNTQFPHLTEADQSLPSTRLGIRCRQALCLTWLTRKPNEKHWAREFRNISMLETRISKRYNFGWALKLHLHTDIPII